MPTKTYKIRVEVDDRQPLASQHAMTNGFTKLELAAKKLGDTQEREAKRAADAAVRETKKATDAAEKAHKREETAAEKKYAKIMAGVAKTHAAEDAAHKKSQANFGKTNSLADQFAGKLVGLAAGYLGIQAVASTITQAWDKAQQSSAAAIAMVNDYRNALRELSYLKGKGGETTQETADQLKTRSRTLQTKDEAIRFQERFVGMGESMMDKPGMPGNMTEIEYKKYMELQGAKQASIGADPDAFAQQAALMPQMMAGTKGGHFTAEQAMRKSEQINRIMKPGGFTQSEGSAALAKIAPWITSGVIGLEKGTALLSAISVINTQSSAEEFDRLMRATVGGIGRKRSGVEGGESQGKYLKGLGVDPAKEDGGDIADRISDDMQKQEDEAAKSGKGFNPLDYLKHHGFLNTDEAKALLSHHTRRQSKKYEKQFKPLTEYVPTMEESMESIEKFRADPTGARREADINVESAKASQGIKRGPLDTLKRNIFAGLVTEGLAQGEFEEYGKSNMPNGWAEAQTMRSSLNKFLSGARQKAGLPGKDYGWTSSMGPEDEATFYNKDMEEIKKAGGSVTPSTEKIIAALDRNTKATQDLTNANKGKDPKGGNAGAARPMPLASPIHALVGFSL